MGKPIDVWMCVCVEVNVQECVTLRGVWSIVNGDSSIRSDLELLLLHLDCAMMTDEWMERMKRCLAILAVTGEAWLDVQRTAQGD